MFGRMPPPKNRETSPVRVKRCQSLSLTVLADAKITSEVNSKQEKKDANGGHPCHTQRSVWQTSRRRKDAETTDYKQTELTPKAWPQRSEGEMSRESACGTGMLISDGASEKRWSRCCCCCCCSPCAQEGALNVEEEEEERKREREGRMGRWIQQRGEKAA